MCLRVSFLPIHKTRTTTNSVSAYENKVLTLVNVERQKTPEAVVTAWMNSPGHRANILKSSFTHIGVGC